VQQLSCCLDARSDRAYVDLLARVVDEIALAAQCVEDRLAASRESMSTQDVLSASYLRRKSSQGKADRKPPQA